MGLISRVSSRTYREKSTFTMKSRLLNFVFRRSSEAAEKKSTGFFKKAYESPLPINVRGDLYRHADRYGLRTYSLKELSETGPDFLRGIAWTAIAVFLVWDVFHDVSCHNALYSDPKNKQFHFFQDDMDLFGNTEGALEVKLLKRRKCCMEDICFMVADFHKIPCSTLANHMEVYKRKIRNSIFMIFCSRLDLFIN